MRPPRKGTFRREIIDLLYPNKSMNNAQIHAIVGGKYHIDKTSKCAHDLKRDGFLLHSGDIYSLTLEARQLMWAEHPVGEVAKPRQMNVYAQRELQPKDFPSTGGTRDDALPARAICFMNGAAL